MKSLLKRKWKEVEGSGRSLKQAPLIVLDVHSAHAAACALGLAETPLSFEIVLQYRDSRNWPTLFIYLFIYNFYTRADRMAYGELARF